MKISRSLLFAMLIASFAVTAVAVSGQDKELRIVNGGVLNGKAISLPKPVYNDEAKAAGVDGTIAVKIVIDEFGDVISAVADPNDQRQRHDADGNILEPEPADPRLMESAEKAARMAKFSPTLLSGQPVKVSGMIVYNFVAPGADAPTEGRMSRVNGGLLNGKATSLPKPEYPVGAKAVGAKGAVSVQIVIDENGDVISASAVSGHPLLRSVAVAAAREAKFAPTQLSGKPVKVSGILTFNFVLP